MIVCKNREEKNCWDIEEGSFSGDCQDDFMNKYIEIGNREVKIAEMRQKIFGGDCRGGFMHK